MDRIEPNAAVPIQETVAYRMYRASRLIRHLHFQTFQASGFDLTPEQWFILNKLAQKSPQSQTELGESLIDDRPNMTRILAALEKKAWISRRADPEDRRRTEVALTEEGHRVLAQCLPLAETVRDQLRDGLAEPELAQFFALLAMLEQNMERLLGE